MAVSDPNIAISDYLFGASPVIPELKLSRFPEDTDWARCSMLHDNSAYRLYVQAQS